MNKYPRIIFISALIATISVQADTNNTKSQYLPTTGQAVPGMVILQSTDGINAKPIDASNPLQVTVVGGGGSTTANQGTPNTAANGWPVYLEFGGVALALGATTASGSIPVVLASNQPAIPVTPSLPTAIAPIVAGSAASSSVLKATPGALQSVYATCTASCYLMIFNAVSAPANGATTAGIASGNMQECIGPSLSPSISYSGLPPSTFTVGITAAISSTACATLTLSAVGFIHGTVQ